MLMNANAESRSLLEVKRYLVSRGTYEYDLSLAVFNLVEGMGNKGNSHAIEARVYNKERKRVRRTRYMVRVICVRKVTRQEFRGH